MPEHLRAQDNVERVEEVLSLPPLTTWPGRGKIVKVASLKNPADLRRRLTELGVHLPLDDTVLSAAEHSPLATRLPLGHRTAGNRWGIHPMEGCNAHSLEDIGHVLGSPTTRTIESWRRYGASGAKWILGGEAAAVQKESRANPRQTLATVENQEGITTLLSTLRQEHQRTFGPNACDDLVTFLQLTESGRFRRPNGQQKEPRIFYHHPLNDSIVGVQPDDDSALWTNDELDRLPEKYVTAAGVAKRAGFDGVEVKMCHGYGLHESLSAFRRPGKYGGDFEGRTRLVLSIIDAIRAAHPELLPAVRLSAYDTVRCNVETGDPLPHDHLLPYEYAFGVNPENPLEIDLREPIQLIQLLAARGVKLINVSCGCPYYSPRIQRPSSYPSPGAPPPVYDPLIDVATLAEATHRLRLAVPGPVFAVGGLSYLQEFLPNVAQALVRHGWIDIAGIGRRVLPDHSFPARTLTQGAAEERTKVVRGKICRTFLQCVKAMRADLPDGAGCYPLDPTFHESPSADLLRQWEETQRTQPKH